MKIINKVIDIICFVFGPFILVLNLFDVSWSNAWSEEETLGIAIGVVLICIGFLRIYWGKNKERS